MWKPSVVILAFGLILCAALGQAQEQPEQTQREAQQEQRPAQPLPLPFRVEVVEDQAEAEARQRHEAEARQREIEDLIAQQGMNAATQAMNEATQEMRDYARIQTWLIGIGTALVAGTLYLMIGANRAAVAAVSTTRQIGEKQVRAYLNVKDVRVENVNTDQKPSLKFVLANSGQSPARRVFMKYVFMITPDPDGYKVDLRHAKNIGEGVMEIPSGEGFSEYDDFTPLYLSEEAIFSMTQGNLAFVFAGYIRYEDVFGYRRRAIMRLRTKRDIWSGVVGFTSCRRNNRSN